MENQENYNKAMQTKSNQNIQSTKESSKDAEILSASVALACVRWNKDIDNFPIHQFYKDVKSSFAKVPMRYILEAIRNGSLGMYGNVYDLSIGQIMIWIRQYLKDHPIEDARMYVKNHLTYGQLIGKEPIRSDKYPEYNGLFYHQLKDEFLKPKS